MEPNLDELIQHFISLSQKDIEHAFEKGEIACHLIQMGETYETLSAKVNCSPEQIRVLTKTFLAFPKESDRPYAELSYYHYRLAARTDDPHKWMQEATDNEWSTRELSKALKGEVIPDENRDLERLLFKVKTILNEQTDRSEWLANKLSATLVAYNTNACLNIAHAIAPPLAMPLANTMAKNSDLDLR